MTNTMLLDEVLRSSARTLDAEIAQYQAAAEEMISKAVRLHQTTQAVSNETDAKVEARRSPMAQWHFLSTLERVVSFISAPPVVRLGLGFAILAMVVWIGSSRDGFHTEPVDVATLVPGSINQVPQLEVATLFDPADSTTFPLRVYDVAEISDESALSWPDDDLQAHPAGIDISLSLFDEELETDA